MNDILHEIIDHLPIHESVKKELHAKLDVTDASKEEVPNA
jgi:hypothetical protein